MKNKVFTAILASVMAMSAAASAAEVNVYSERQPALINPVLHAFTKSTGIRVNMVYLSQGMLERVKAEGANTPADMILTADITSLINHAEEGLLQPFKSGVLAENIPAQFRHPDGLWYGLTSRARVVFAHKGRVKKDEVATYEDLASPKMKGRVCSRSGKHPYNVTLLAWMIATRGEAVAEAWVRGVRANLARKPQGNDRSQAKAIYQGECDVAIGNTYYMGKMMTNKKDPEEVKWADAVRIIFPDQNGGGTHVNTSGAGVIKSARNKAEAITLIEFLSSESAQKIYAEVDFEYPVKPGVKLDPIVAGWGNFKADTTSLAKIVEYRTQATRLMDKVAFDN